jgi:hypothetical protein
MATDNVTLTASADPSTPASGTVIATDLIGGVNYQRVKITYGADGTATDAASGAGLPVAQDGTWSVAQSGTWSVNAVQSGTWNVTNISGTISLPTGAATDASLTNGNQKTKLLDSAGTNVASISAAGAVKVDNSAVTQPVSGTVTANAGTGSFTVTQTTASNLKVDLSGTAANTTAIKVDGSAVTQPVSYATTGSGTATGALRVELANNGTGTLSTVSTVSAVTAITNALPAGTNAIGKTSVSYQTTKALTHASISISSSGDNTVVAGTAAQTIRIFKLVLVPASGVSVTLKDGASTSLTGAIPLTANGSLVIDGGDGEPELITSSANAFVVNLSGAVTVTGWVQYTKS